MLHVAVIAVLTKLEPYIARPTHQLDTKRRKSMEKLTSLGKVGGSSSKIFVSISKSVLQPLYGKIPLASSTSDIPRLHTSARMS